MQQDVCRMLDKEEKIVANPASLRMEMCEIVRTAAFPVAPGDSVKAALRRAARNLSGTGLSERRVRSLWHQAADTWAHEADALRAWHADWKRREIARLANELTILQAQIGATHD